MSSNNITRNPKVEEKPLAVSSKPKGFVKSSPTMMSKSSIAGDSKVIGRSASTSKSTSRPPFGSSFKPKTPILERRPSTASSKLAERKKDVGTHQVVERTASRSTSRLKALIDENPAVSGRQALVSRPKTPVLPSTTSRTPSTNKLNSNPSVATSSKPISKSVPTNPTSPEDKTPAPTPEPTTIFIPPYTITLPSSPSSPTEKCFLVRVVYSCFHPVLIISKVRYPGCDREFVAEVNWHGGSCGKGGKECVVEEVVHVVGEKCAVCEGGEGKGKGREEILYGGLGGAGWRDPNKNKNKKKG